MTRSERSKRIEMVHLARLFRAKIIETGKERLKRETASKILEKEREKQSRDERRNQASY